MAHRSRDRSFAALTGSVHMLLLLVPVLKIVRLYVLSEHGTPSSLF